jgi:CTP synthase
VVSGTSPDRELVEVVELKDHPFFVAVQYHPEFKSRPNHPHPLFTAFLGTALLVKKRTTSLNASVEVLN